ncbi:hypothetical protein FN846DRAFT_528849 [Sphaerosporella brunnea]|uniref:Uncharacterized protein n=1 Tax=Sphaerosporella brunnea TaxID=1250544 RepID=A0A5J5EDR1_9PEZI|nr:hypothetical protein FN846DRAFT_528849 [Sphaerosporella brunnea]
MRSDNKAASRRSGRRLQQACSESRLIHRRPSGGSEIPPGGSSTLGAYLREPFGWPTMAATLDILRFLGIPGSAKWWRSLEMRRRRTMTTTTSRRRGRISRRKRTMTTTTSRHRGGSSRRMRKRTMTTTTSRRRGGSSKRKRTMTTTTSRRRGRSSRRMSEPALVAMAGLCCFGLVSFLCPLHLYLSICSGIQECRS